VALMTSSTSIDNAIAELCPECGLCCNGVLFADVKLVEKDNPDALKAAGLRLKRRGEKHSFPQPCSCFNGKLCTIYSNRPNRCVAFECGLLKRLHIAEITAPQALKKIKSARRQADAVRDLLRELGNHDEQTPLSKRYAKVMAEPMDLSGEEDLVDARGKLMMAVHDLMQLLQRDFLTVT
jgi:Fe-S-cluster containining protein